MKILLVTPLFPPDTAPLAVYTKTLATQLSITNDVTVLQYGCLPESVENVKFISLDKRAPTILRLLKCTYALMKIRTHFDIIYVQNGPSVEIPLFLLHLLTNTPYIIRLGDQQALNRSCAHKLHRTIFKKVLEDADAVIMPPTFSSECIQVTHGTIIDDPHEKPEILPYDPYPTRALSSYDDSWKAHIDALLVLFEHART